jgi:hypothetical protein
MYRVYLDKTDNYMIQLDIIKGKRSRWVSLANEELSTLLVECYINSYSDTDFLELLIESPTLITKYTHPELFI